MDTRAATLVGWVLIPALLVGAVLLAYLYNWRLLWRSGPASYLFAWIAAPVLLAGLPAAFLRVAEPTGYPGDSWLEALTEDGRMRYSDMDIQYIDGRGSMFEELSRTILVGDEEDEVRARGRGGSGSSEEEKENCRERAQRTHRELRDFPHCKFNAVGCPMRPVR